NIRSIYKNVVTLLHMKTVFFLALFFFSRPAYNQTAGATKRWSNASYNKIATDFRTLLRRPPVEFRASFQTYVTDSVIMEKGFIYTEEAERVPILIYKPLIRATNSFPAVICLHGTGGSKDEESITNLLYQFSKRGIMGIAIDARYHGERIAGAANKAEQYIAAIASEWKNPDTKNRRYPFYYDTVYDLWRLIDYLVTRPDVQPNRIGMMGISMGGIETWLAASVDKRIKVAVPVIAAQSFKWSLENNRWQGRARTIWSVHEQAAKDAGGSNVAKESVRSVWAKLIPGITEEFDCPSMIRLFAPRPLLLLNNGKDENCPLPGAKIAFNAAKNAYKATHAANKLQVRVIPNEPHRFLPQHAEMTLAWFKKWL
ncbi:MAG TPA: alpha/beta hydrolase family protein, partial [Segetibacter sp.]